MMAYTDLLPVMFMFSVISVFLGVFLYLLFKMLKLESFERMWKMELVEAFFSLLLFSLFLFVILPFLIFAFLNYISSFQNAQISPLERQLFSQTPSLAVVVRMGEVYGYLETLRRSFVFFLAIADMGKVKFAAGNAPLIGVSWGVIAAIANNIFYSILQYQYLLLLFFKIVLTLSLIAEFLMPIGLMLRVFPPTRGVGAFLLAFSFSFYIIFPIVYVALAGFEMTPELKKLLDGIPQDCLVTGYLNNLFVYNIQSNVYGPNVLYVYLYVVKTLISLLGLGCGLFSSFSSLFQFIVSFGDIVSFFLYEIIIIPLVSLALSLSMVNMLTTVLGGRISEIGRGLFKFI